MLEFASKPDEVLMDLLHGGLEITIDMLQDKLPPQWHPLPEDVVAMFGGDRAIQKVLKAVLAASRAPEIHAINDYHMILLYTVLTGQCDVYNDTVRLRAGDLIPDWPPMMVDGKEVRHMDPDELVDWFFPDTDFLGLVDALDPGTPQELLDALGLRETTMGVLSRMKPHPDELKLVPLDGVLCWQGDGPLPAWWR